MTIQSTEPYVGQTVQYISRGSADGVYEPEVRAAIITALHWSDAAGQEDWKNEPQPYRDGDDQAAQYISAVDICVLSPTGLFFHDFATFNHGDDVVGGTWRFIPEEAALRAVGSMGLVIPGAGKRVWPPVEWRPLDVDGEQVGEYRYLDDGALHYNVTAADLRDGPCAAEHPEFPRIECIRPAHNVGHHVNHKAPAGKQGWETRS